MVKEIEIPEGYEAKIEDNKVIFVQKESEDERIRKWILEKVQGYASSGIPCSDEIKMADKAIDYLEKQKDASKAVEAVERIDKYIDEHLANAHDMKDSNPDKKYYRGWDDALGKMAGILQDVYSDEKQKEQNSEDEECISQLTVKGKGVYKICPHCKERMIRDDSKVYTSMPPQYGYNCPKCGAMEFDIVKYDNPETEEQKPAEWSEDEKIRNELLKEIEFISPRDGETDSEGLILPSYRARIDKYRTYLEKQKEQKPAVEQLDGTFNSYDMAKTFVEGQYYVMEHPERFGLCKPVEWSDEDKRMIDNIIYCLPGMATGTIEMLPSLAKQYALRLKSLFPSWKPSEQEKDALRTAIHILTEERNFPKTVAQLQNILNAFEGKESRKDWKPSEDEERLIKTSISFLKDFADKGYENAVECIDWLKSKLNGDACK